MGAFCMVVFNGVFSDGSKGEAVMLDSFAVHPKFAGKGVGGKLFHQALRGLINASRYVVFAQCLKTGAARQFWFDKLY